MEKKNKLKLWLFILLFAVTVFSLREASAYKQLASGYYFLDVGQGDSEMAVFKDGVKVLTDAGPDRKISSSLGEILNPLDNYIDIGIITHPQMDHYNGFNELLTRYNFGAIIMNGRSPDAPAREWSMLLAAIRKKNIPIVILGRGDKIIHGNEKIEIISPDTIFIASKDLNDTCIVEKIELENASALFTGDIGKKVEAKLAKNGSEIRADILKVAHHGSKYSSTQNFLLAVDPVVAVAGVAKKNRYGHPSPDTVSRIVSLGAKFLDTALNGTIGIFPSGGELKIRAKTSVN